MHKPIYPPSYIQVHHHSPCGIPPTMRRAQNVRGYPVPSTCVTLRHPTRRVAPETQVAARAAVSSTIHAQLSSPVPPPRNSDSPVYQPGSTSRSSWYFGMLPARATAHVRAEQYQMPLMHDPTTSGPGQTPLHTNVLPRSLYRRTKRMYQLPAIQPSSTTRTRAALISFCADAVSPRCACLLHITPTMSNPARRRGDACGGGRAGPVATM
ncbi:hypothetical protein C8T65DRAFT_676139 [Cerioporus squamosus]|nr:hypothetical protein C8T65DRAFT_676139 [Cerioporus squamosus]